MRILLTGGNGSIATKLTDKLLQEGYEVVHLSRKKSPNSKVPTYLWNIDAKIIDEECINGVDIIIHLAGAGIADKKWTSKRKDEIIKSRTASTKLLYQLLKNKKNQVNTIISASASGYYSDRGDELLDENSHANTDFLAECCIKWEASVDEGKLLNLRIVKFRTGIVLEKNDGALAKIAAPIKYGFGAALGDGKQWISWIHVNDAVNMYLYAVKNKSLTGVYNMSTPYPVTNFQLTKSIAQVLQKPIWLPNIPKFILKLLLGEMSIVVLGSTKMSANKITNSGFTFKYPDIISALKNIYGK